MQWKATGGQRVQLPNRLGVVADLRAEAGWSFSSLVVIEHKPPWRAGYEQNSRRTLRLQSDGQHEKYHRPGEAGRARRAQGSRSRRQPVMTVKWLLRLKHDSAPWDSADAAVKWQYKFHR